MRLKKGEIEIQKIAEDVYAGMVEDNGLGWSNSGFIDKGEGLVVDTMYDLNFAQNLKDLYFEVSKKDPGYIVNTHANGDHMWGNQIFEKACIIGHTTLLEDASREKPEDFEKLKILAKATDDPGIKQIAKYMAPFDFNGINITLPKITFEKRMTLNLGGTEVEFIHSGPAHTRGDVMAWIPNEKVLFAGDIVFNKCTPICWMGVGIKNWIKVLDYVIDELNPKVIVPGHGPICSTKEVKEFKSYLQYIIMETEKYYNDGIVDPMEICKRIDLQQFISWTEPERIYINVNTIVKGIKKDFSPVNFVEISRNVKELSDYIKDNY